MAVECAVVFFYLIEIGLNGLDRGDLVRPDLLGERAERPDPLMFKERIRKYFLILTYNF